MNDFDPITESNPIRRECAAGLAALQRHLDGEADWDSSEAAAHRIGCVICREELALASLLNESSTVIVPAGLTDRIWTSAIAGRRRRAQRYAGAGLALAASVAIAVIALRPLPEDKGPGPVAIVPAAKISPAPPAGTPPTPLGASVSEARDAIVSLTKRTAMETRDQSARLLPNPKMPDAPSAGVGLEPLADARTGAARSVEPFRDSARRALNFFARAAEPPGRRE